MRFFDWYQGLGLPHCFLLVGATEATMKLAEVSLCGRARKANCPRQREAPVTQSQQVAYCHSCQKAEAKIRTEGQG